MPDPLGDLSFSGPYEDSTYVPTPWLFVYFEGDHPHVFNPLPWDTTTFDLTLDVTGYASPRQSVTLSIFVDDVLVQRLSEQVKPDYGNIVTFDDVLGNPDAEYAIGGATGSLLFFNPFQITPHEAVPPQGDPCLDANIRDVCDTLGYQITCTLDSDCNSIDLCQDAQTGCELVYFAIACIADPDCPEITDPCTLVYVAGACGPLPDPCDEAPVLCNPPPLCDVVDALGGVPGACGYPLPPDCDGPERNAICDYIDLVVDCTEDPDCPEPIDHCQYLDGVPGLCGPVPPPCDVLDEVGGVPGTCGKPVPDPCDPLTTLCLILVMLTDCVDDPGCPEPIDHCDYLDAAPGVCGNPWPPDCDGQERDSLCDTIDGLTECINDPNCPEPIDYCNYLDAAPGVCGNPWPADCDGQERNSLCDVIDQLEECIEEIDCLKPFDHCHFLDDVPVLCEPVPGPCEVMDGRSAVPGTCGEPLPTDCDGEQRSVVCHAFEDPVLECLKDVRDCLGLDLREPCKDCDAGAGDDEDGRIWAPPSNICRRELCTVSTASCVEPNLLSGCPENDILAALDVLLAEISPELAENASLQVVMDSARDRLRNSVGPSCAELVGDLCTQTERAIVDCVFVMECDDLPGFGALCQQSNQTCSLVNSLMQSCTFGSDCPGIEVLVDAIAEPLHAAAPADLKLEAINLDEVPRNAEGVIDLIGSEPGATASSSSMPGVEVARYDGILTSPEGPGDSGVLKSFNVDDGYTHIHVSLKYCYIGATNNNAAQWHTIASWSGTPFTSETFSFRTPSTGSKTAGVSNHGSCAADDASTFQEIQYEHVEDGGESSFHFAFDEIRFDFVNGDERIALADIVVTAWRGSPGDENIPPQKPESFNWPSEGGPGKQYCFSVRAYDANGDNLGYEFDWGDGSYTVKSPYPHNQWISACKTWSQADNYRVRVVAFDTHGDRSQARTGWVNIAEENQKPYPPSKPSGPMSGTTSHYSYFRTEGEDPDGNDIRYEFSWGDSTTTFTKWRSSGDYGLDYHRWSTPGTYAIKARSLDTRGAVSDWSESHTIVIQDSACGGPTASDMTSKNGLGVEDEITPDIEQVDLAWGGWKREWSYYTEDCRDAYHVAETGFGFGYYGHNRLNGDHVLRFGGSIGTASCPYSAGSNAGGYNCGPIRHVARIHDLEFFYSDEGDAGRVHYAAGLVGRAAEECVDGPGKPFDNTAAKIVMTIAGFKLPWLGFATLLPDEYCTEHWENTYASPRSTGLGVHVTSVETINGQQDVSGYINTDYGTEVKRHLDAWLYGIYEYDVVMVGCYDCNEYGPEGPKWAEASGREGFGLRVPMEVV